MPVKVQTNEGDKRYHLLELLQVRFDIGSGVDKLLDIVHEGRDGNASGVRLSLRTAGHRPNISTEGFFYFYFDNYTRNAY